jgi:hypothetical protein
MLHAESVALQESLGSPTYSARALRVAAEDELEMGEPDRATELFQRALELARAAELDGEMVMTLHGLGDVCLVRGETEAAAGFYVEALSASVDETPAAHCLGGLAAVAALEERVDEAGRIWGAVESYGQRLGERIMLPQTVGRYEAAFRQIDEARFADAVAAGRELTLEEATREALETFGTRAPTVPIDADPR